MNIISADEIERIPVEPPRRADLLPGLRLGRVVSMRLLAMPLALLALMAVMPLIVLTQERRAMLALRETETVSGRIESVASARSCQGGGTDISYSFTASTGVEFRGLESVCSGATYAEVRPGDAIPVIYAKSNPAINAVADSQAANPAFFLLPMIVFPLFGLLFIGPTFWPRISQTLKDRHLFQAGTLTSGRVIFVSSQQGAAWPGWPSPTRGDVFVSARLRSGDIHEVQAACTNEWLLTHLAPGTEVNLCVKDGRAVLLENYAR